MPSTLRTLTLLQHARLSALAEPALLALAPHVHVHLAAAAALAGVLRALDDAAAEEALAALAAQHVVVEARRLVPAHAAHLVAQHLGGGPLLPLHRRLPVWGGRGRGGMSGGFGGSNQTSSVQMC